MSLDRRAQAIEDAVDRTPKRYTVRVAWARMIKRDQELFRRRAAARRAVGTRNEQKRAQELQLAGYDATTAHADFERALHMFTPI